MVIGPLFNKDNKTLSVFSVCPAADKWMNENCFQREQRPEMCEKKQKPKSKLQGESLFTLFKQKDLQKCS